MKQRLVPFRSLRRHEAEQALVVAASAAVGLATRILVDRDFALIGFLIATLASSPLLDAWAGWSGLERVTRDEERKRHRQERAGAPVWVEALNHGTSMGSIITSVALVGLFPEYPAHFPAIAGASFLAGACGGAYLAIEARRDASQSSPFELPAREGAMRHALGYVAGLAAALAASSLFESGLLAAAAMFVAFLAAKFAADMQFPNPMPAPKPMKSWHFFAAFPLAMVWWGLPIGTLAAAMTVTANPAASSRDLLLVFATAAFVCAVAATAAAVLARLMGLVPHNETPDSR